MLRSKHLEPGKVLRLCADQSNRDDAYCMLIAVYSIVHRRHAKKSAPSEGWDVLLFWFDKKSNQITRTRISAIDRRWYAGWKK